MLDEFKVFPPFYTGYPSIDLFLGGIPSGGFIEISGRDNSGKTTLVQNFLASIQENYPDVRTMLIDTEGNIDPEYLVACGVNLDSLSKFVLNNDIVQVLDSVIEFINASKGQSFICIDSLAGFSSEAEIKKGVDGSTVGITPRVLNKFLRISTIPVKITGSTVIFTNQIRDDLNSMWGGTTTPGGHGLKHWAKLRLKLYDKSGKADAVKEDGEVIGNPVLFTVEKIKGSTAYRGFSFTMDLVYGEGFSKTLDVLNTAINLGIVNKAGAFYSFEDKKFRGKEAILTELKSNKEFLQALSSKLK